MIFVFGASRSGTSWLAKIFDSHPETLYRHEPDSLLRNDDIPYLHESANAAPYLDQLRQYISDLLMVRQLKTAGSLPVFRKDYLPRGRAGVRTAIIMGLRTLERIPALNKLAGRPNIPDLVKLEKFPRDKIVIKSVGSLGRTKLFAEAFPKSRFVIIVRHPCGHVSSIIKGQNLNKMPKSIPIDGLARTDMAQSYGLSLEKMSAMTLIQQLTWRWVILNDIAMAHAGNLDKDRVRIIRYEDLCAAPLDMARSLLDFSSLAWQQQTADFLGESTTSDGKDRYFSVRRDPLKAAMKWQEDLDQNQIDEILDIVSGSQAGKLFTP